MSTSAGKALRHVWSASPPLVALTLVMLVTLAFNVAGLLVDPRIITGAPAWLKPAKFAVSNAAYAISVAWLFRYLPKRRRLRGWTGPVIAVSLAAETVIINLQAARGTTSHFNVRTVPDAMLLGVMAVSIACLWAASLAICVALFRQRFQDAALGWSVRFGMAITLFGASLGGLMTAPTATQWHALREGHRVPTVGAHTVGAADGGAGDPLMGWSTDHGDLRVSHFVGLHALQLLPLLLLGIRRLPTSSARQQSQVVVTLSLSYAALIAILLWQALRGEPVLSPGTMTVTVSASWLATSVAGLFIAWAYEPGVAA